MKIKALLLACVLLITPLMASVDPSEVTTLDLSYKEDLTSIRELQIYSRLRDLNLQGSDMIEDLEEVGKLTTLTKLNLSSIFYKDEVTYPETLDFLRPLTLLEELQFRHNERVLSVKPLATLPNLRSLDISYSYMDDWEALTTFPALRELKINYVRVDFDLSFLTLLPFLEDVYVTDYMLLPPLPPHVRVHIYKLRAQK